MSIRLAAGEARSKARTRSRRPALDEGKEGSQHAGSDHSVVLRKQIIRQVTCDGWFQPGGSLTIK
jgi:hypothetical protein